MRWQYNIEGARLGMILALCVALAALWLVAAYGFYKENERAKYDVEICPGAVTYGTHSTALMPMTVSPMKHTLPMISGNTIRSLAHSGHATSVQASQQTMHTTSSAVVKTAGSGIVTTNHTEMYHVSGKSERGIVHHTFTIAMPMIAWNPTQALAQNGFSLRKAKPGPAGTEGEWRWGGEGDVDDVNNPDWWRFDEGEWVKAQNGDTRPAGGGNFWLFKDGTWILVNNMGDPVVPVGATPWLLILLLATAYAIKHSAVSRQHSALSNSEQHIIR